MERRTLAIADLRVDRHRPDIGRCIGASSFTAIGTPACVPMFRLARASCTRISVASLR